MDREEIAALYDAHATTIARYVHRRLGPEHVDDAVADVFLRALRSAPGYEAMHDSALPWLFGIAAHVVADARRSEARRLRALRRASRTSDRHRAENDLGIDERLLGALRRLAAADRETLLLVAWGELTYEETAAALDIPVGTVRSRMNRARRKLAPLVTNPDRAHPRTTHPEDVPHA